MTTSAASAQAGLGGALAAHPAKPPTRGSPRPFRARGVRARIFAALLLPFEGGAVGETVGAIPAYP